MDYATTEVQYYINEKGSEQEVIPSLSSSISDSWNGEPYVCCWDYCAFGTWQDKMKPDCHCSGRYFHYML